MKNFIKTIIGKQAYPIDNSYCCNILTGERAYLAGIEGEQPKLVTIISEPYQAKHIVFGKPCIDTFVTVLYENELYIVTNSFSDTLLDEIDLDTNHLTQD